MKIIETCPRCGADLIDVVIATYPDIIRKECWSCGWASHGEKEEVIRIPFGGNRNWLGSTEAVTNSHYAPMGPRDKTYEEKEEVIRIPFVGNSNWPDTTEINKSIRYTPMGPSDKAYDGSPCQYCSNNPKNGGSGICHCILGLKPIIC